MPDCRWQILGVLFLARTAMGFQFQAVAATAPLLIAELHLGYAAVGTLIGLYILPGIPIAFPGGLLSRRFGDKAVCVAGLALMMAGGVLMGAGHDVVVVFAGRLVSGTGAVLFNLVLTKMATDWFAGREIVLAMGVVLASWPFGIAVGPPAGAIMALPARVLSPVHRAGGLGVFLTCYYAILSAGPALAGVLRAHWGSKAAMLFAAALMVVVAPLLGLFGALVRRARPAGG